MPKELLVIDQDDCISTGNLLFAINDFMKIHGLKCDYVNENFKDYYMQDVIPTELKKEFNEYVSYINLYERAYLLPDAREVLEKLNECYRLVLVTDYILPEIKNKCGINLKNKFNFLCRELPFLDPSNFVFTSSKDIIYPDIAIDDRVKHLRNARRKLLFSAYHNLYIPEKELETLGIERTDSWQEVEKKLIKK